jgi:hypothetical protein
MVVSHQSHKKGHIYETYDNALATGFALSGTAALAQAGTPGVRIIGGSVSGFVRFTVGGLVCE